MADKASTHYGPHFFPDGATFASIDLPGGAAAPVGDDEVKANAGIAASKLIQRIRARHTQGNVAATTETRFLHVAKAAGTVLSVRAGDIARATGAATVTFNVRKNGVTILTGVLTLDATHPASATYGAVTGTVDGALDDYVADDVFDVVITATAGGGGLPTGVWVEMIADEAP